MRRSPLLAYRVSASTVQVSHLDSRAMRLFSQNVKIEALKRAPLFEGLSKKELARACRRHRRPQRPAAGPCSAAKGGSGDEFFVIVDGEAEVTKGGRRLASRSGGDFVGEIALLTTKKRTATVTATTQLRCFVLTQSAFHRVLEENPSVQLKVHAGARRAAFRQRRPLVALGVARAAEAREHFAALRALPPPERRSRDERVGRPGAAAQDAHVVAEVHLGALRIRERDEARVGLEGR